MLSMQGLGDYSRNDGYVKGDVTMTNETIKCNYDRGRKFYVDALDNQETAKVAVFPSVRRVHPHEGGAGTGLFPLRILCGKSGISKDRGRSARTARRCWRRCAAVTKMDEDEVPTENRHLFITPTLDGMI